MQAQEISTDERLKNTINFTKLVDRPQHRQHWLRIVCFVLIEINFGSFNNGYFLITCQLTSGVARFFGARGE